MKRLFTLLLLPLAFQGFAQDIKRTNTWYFGKYAGLSFSTTPPTALSNSAINTYEGSSAISDTAGNLLFYTDGTQVWNKNHQLMTNGTGLNGNISSRQGSIIIPKPGSDSLYYLFTTDMQGNAKGLCYSIININLNGGLGDVITKNVQLISPVCEAIAATKHANNNSIWLLAHGYNSNNYYAFIITNDGVKSCPVTTSIGSNLSGIPSYPFNAQNSMNFSNKGDKIINTIFSNQSVELLDFDKTNGGVSNLKKINNIETGIGVQFSPNDSLLYLVDRDTAIFQFQTYLSSEILINSSKKKITTQKILPFYHIQIGADDKIYVSHFDSTYLSVINAPNVKDTACNFVYGQVNLNAKSRSFPNFMASYFYKYTQLNFDYHFLCPYQQGQFTSRNHTSSPQWTITKLSSAGSWVYNGTTATHNFDSGTYTVKLKAGADSIIKTITVGWSGELLLASDTNRCQTDSVFLTIRNSQSFSCIKWNDTISSNSITAKTNGTYRVSAWNMQGCKLSDSIHVRLFATPPDPLVKPMPDTIIFCKGNSIALIPDSGANFQWQDGYPFASRIVDTTGLFYTSWTDSFTCQRGDTTRLIFYPTTPLQNPLPDSVTFCIGKTMTLLPDSGTNFHWQDNYPNATRTIDSAGLFFTNWYDTNGCRMADSIRIKTYSVTKPTVQQSGDSLFAFGNFAQWQWLFNNQPLNGAIFAKYKALQNGFYKVRGTDTFSCIAVSDSVNITNVSIRQLISPNEISVFPNPVNNVLHIELNTATEKLQSVYLLNSTGQLVYCETSPNPSETAINCSAFPKGIYLLKLFTTNKTYYQKLIIE